MEGIIVKQQQLEQLAPVGVDIDTVKMQLEEYKVRTTSDPMANVEIVSYICLEIANTSIA